MWKSVELNRFVGKIQSKTDKASKRPWTNESAAIRHRGGDKIKDGIETKKVEFWTRLFSFCGFGFE